MCSCSTLRRRIKGAASTINAIYVSLAIFSLWLEVIVRWPVPFSLVAYQVSGITALRLSLVGKSR